MFLTPPMSDAEWLAHTAGREAMLASVREAERKIINLDEARKKLRKAGCTVPKIVKPIE